MPDVSRTSISNMALAELPANPIASMEEESLEARECKRVYDQCLEELLEIHEWSMANRRETLAAVTNTRSGEWSYAYAVPTGVGTPRRILPTFEAATSPGWGDDYPKIDYVIENGVIFTNQENAVLEFGASTVAEAVMPALFRRALVLEIASRIVMPIKKSREIKADLIKQAEVAKDRAKADDMSRQPRRDAYYEPEAGLVRNGLYDPYADRPRMAVS